MDLWFPDQIVSWLHTHTHARHNSVVLERSGQCCVIVAAARPLDVREAKFHSRDRFSSAMVVQSFYKLSVACHDNLRWRR